MGICGLNSMEIFISNFQQYLNSLQKSENLFEDFQEPIYSCIALLDEISLNYC